MESSDHESVIFRDDLWAAEIGPGMEVPGWFVLRTRRHAELITGLHDAEVDGLGRRLRALVAAVAAATGAPATYQFVFLENNRHYHALVAARGEQVPAERRGGNLLKLLDEGHRDLAACQAIVPEVRAAYHRIVDRDQQTTSTQRG
jgi:diadenosine tetraphosphate (Ap4A) HIT family hydrolase